MRYIDQILQPGETIVYRSSVHWIVYLPSGLFFVAALVALTQSGGARAAVWLMVAAGCAIVGAFDFVRAWFRRWTTEIDVTDRRIVYKRGFIRRHTVEMNMDKVESVDVDQSIWGRLFDYGDITIHGTGVGIEPLHMIDNPLAFRNHVTAR